MEARVGIERGSFDLSVTLWIEFEGGEVSHPIWSGCYWRTDELPADAKRLIQRADGYIATIKGGHTLMEEGEDTGLRTGSLLRGPR